jgi:hypothetical protein
MPVFGYFCWVGSVFLALLLFVVDRQPPRPAIVAEPFHPNIRIVSQAKPSEALVFSGPTIDYGVRLALEVVDISARATDPAPHTHAETRAEKLPQAKPQLSAKATLQRARKRYAARVPRARLPHHQFDYSTRSPFIVTSGLREFEVPTRQTARRPWL